MNQILQTLMVIFQRLRQSFLQKSVTIEYPFVAKPVAPLARTRIKNLFPECTGCLKCSTVCPVQAIELSGLEYSPGIKRPTTSKGVPFEREIESFVINYSKCTLCGICVQECPTNSLTFDRKISPPQISQHELIVNLVHRPRTMRRGG